MKQAFVLGAAALLVVACGLVACGEPMPTPGLDAPMEPVCTTDFECADDSFCNGAETCDPEAAGADAQGCVASTGSPCGALDCDETTDACIEPECDVDGDGDNSDSAACGGTDCDDEDPRRFRTNTEVCDDDDLDEDCDPLTFGERDRDGDAYPDGTCCNGATCGTDCDDTRSDVHPSLAEVCDWVNNDCDTAIDEGQTVTCFTDADSDGYAPVGATLLDTCACPVRTTAMPPEGDLVDCNDAAAAESPGSPEICSNSLDDDCDGTIDESGNDWYRDCDGDGYGTGTPVRQCTSPGTPGGCPGGGHVLVAGDCDDADDTRNPSVPDACNGRDDDCDGTVDGVDASAWCAAPSRALPHATTVCESAVCAVGSCDAPYLDCGAAAGCEIDGARDGAHCGACGFGCDWSSCWGGRCDPASIAVAFRRSCALLGSGALTCWGRVGSENIVAPPAPTGSYRQIDGACQVTSTGTVECPAACQPGTAITDALEVSTSCRLTGSSGTGCARRATGQVVCWSGTTPAGGAVAAAAGADEIAVGGRHACARLAGRVVCWGTNFDGELGDGTMTDSATGVEVIGLTAAVEIAAGGRFTCARLGDGTVRCWGYNGAGELGRGSTIVRSATPAPVVGLDDAIAIAAGVDTACAVRATGALFCWGAGYGSGSYGRAPVSVTGISGVRAVDLAWDHACAITDRGPYCWGQETYGELGDGGAATSTVSGPVAVLPPP